MRGARRRAAARRRVRPQAAPGPPAHKCDNTPHRPGGARHTPDCPAGVLERGVSDPWNGNPLQGATVTLSKDNATTGTATTTDGGAARFGSLCEGSYHLLVTKDGYHGWDT